MKFTPLQEDKKVYEDTIVPEDMYEFEITHAEEKISKAGNPYLYTRLELVNWNPLKIVHCNLMGFRLKNFCEVTGLTTLYETGEVFVYDVIGKRACARIKITEDPKYGRKNEVAYFKMTPVIVKKVVDNLPEPNDEIPF